MSKFRIGIVGGGIAGLTTAYTLSKEKFAASTEIEIILLEATADMGGRIRTLHNFSSGLYAEAGAISFTNCELEIQALVQELNLTRIDRSDRASKKYRTPKGQLIPWAESEPNRLFKKYILDNIPKTIGDVDDVANLPLDNISMLDFLKLKVQENNHSLQSAGKDLKDSESDVIHAIELSLIGLYCDDFSKMSAINGMRWMSQYLKATKAFSIEGGNDQLICALANAAKKNGVIIKNKTEVIKVIRPTLKSESKCITLITKDKDEQENSLVFDYVVMAVPLSAFQKINPSDANEKCIRFEPELPDIQRSAIDKIQYNQSISRIYFEFKQRFWQKDNQKTAMTITDNPTVWIQDHTAQIDSPSAVVEVFASGKAGELLHTEKDAIASSKRQLMSIWGEYAINSNLGKEEPVKVFWDKEPFQKGAYPYLAPGQAQFPQLIGKSLLSLSFAGEYNSALNPASMNGAVQSAIRACKEVRAEIDARLQIAAKHNFSFWTKTGAAAVVMAGGFMAYNSTH